MLLNESELVKIIKEELHAALAEQDQQEPSLQEQEDSQVDDEAVDVIEDFEELDPEAKAQTRAALGYGVGE